MKRLFYSSTLVAALMLGACQSANHGEIVLTNPLPVERTDDVVELSSADVCARLNCLPTDPLMAVDAEGHTFPLQLTYDSLFVFPAKVAASSSAVYEIRKGVAEDTLRHVQGRYHPERADDIVWENNRAGFRTYGPGIKGVYGYDVFLKRVSRPILDSLYDANNSRANWARVDSLRKAGLKAEAEQFSRSFSFHIDHGVGMDPYAVGPTLGAGAVAVIDGDQFVYPTTYQKYTILDNGPWRFTLELEFAPRAIGMDTAVVEKRLITLNYGSQLNRTTLRYFGLSRAVELASGIVVHESHPGAYAEDAQAGYITYEDLTQEPEAGNGSIYIGVCRPDGFASTGYRPMEKPQAGAVGHILATTPYRPFAAHTYYWGYGWSKYGFDSPEAWQAYLLQYMDCLRQPIAVAWK